MVGESLAVNISVEGRPTPSVQWSLNGSTIGNTATRTVNSTGLVISTVVIEDAGEYEVTGTNDVNSASVSFMVILDRKWPNRHYIDSVTESMVCVCIPATLSVFSQDVCVCSIT